MGFPPCAENVIILDAKTQVGSPAVRLRLVCCTAWVKRWSEAMDFLQTISKIYRNSRNIMSL